MLNLMYPVNLVKGSNSKKLQSRNAQTASVVAEAAEATPAVFGKTAGATLLAKKVMVLNELTLESELFGGLSPDEVKVEQGLAVSEKVDTDACALFPGFSNTAGTTGVALTIDKMIEADYKAGLSFAPGARIFVLGNVQILHLKQYIVTSGASVWANPMVSNLLGEQAQPNGFVGYILNRAVFETQHVPLVNSNADRCGACLNPMYALAAAYVRPPNTEVEGNSSKRTREVSTDYFYDVKERLDGAGCGIISKATA
ncbi:hypothetical protein EP7_004330 [Isosphaeraceae bacterium EP7]